MQMKHAAKAVLIAVVAGGAGLLVGGYANSKSATLQKYPYGVPIGLAVAGGVVLAKARGVLGLAAGLGLAGAGGVLGLMQYQAQKMAQQSQPAQAPATAGYGDAGRWHRSSGVYDRASAGALGGSRAKALLRQQESMGVGDAGAIAGRGRRAVLDAQGLSDL